VIRSADASNLDKMLYALSRRDVTVQHLGLDGNYRNQASGLGIGVYFAYCKNSAVKHCMVQYFGYQTAPAYHASYAESFGVGIFASPGTVVHDIDFRSNAGFDLNISSDTADPSYYSRGCEITSIRCGVPTIAEANTSTDWWDTQAGAFGGIFATNCPGILLADIHVNGGIRFASGASAFARGNPVKLTKCENPVAFGIHVNGMTAGYSTVTTNSTTTVTGALPSGVSGLWNGPWNGASGTNSDVGALIQIEGEGTVRRIVTVNAPSGGTQSIVLDSAVTRPNASGLKYWMPTTGDGISMIGCTDWLLADSVSAFSGDMGFTLSEETTSGTILARGKMVGCVALKARALGVSIYGAVHYVSIDGLGAFNNLQGGSQIWPAGPGYRGGIGMDPIDNTRTQINVMLNGVSAIDDGPTPTYTVTHSAVSVAAAAVVSAAAHNLMSGETVTFAGGTGDWAGINGERAITVIDANSFSVAVNTSAYTGTFGGTIVSNLPYQRAAIDLNTALTAQFALNKWGANDYNRVRSNVPLTGGTYGFTSVSFA
jgi:hypothetical protein